MVCSERSSYPRFKGIWGIDEVKLRSIGNDNVPVRKIHGRVVTLYQPRYAPDRATLVSSVVSVTRGIYGYHGPRRLVEPIVCDGMVSQHGSAVLVRYTRQREAKIIKVGDAVRSPIRTREC